MCSMMDRHDKFNEKSTKSPKSKAFWNECSYVFM